MFMMVLYIVPYASLALRHVLSLRISRRSTLFYFLFYFVLLCSTLFYFVLLLVIHTSVLWFVCLSYDECAMSVLVLWWVCLSYDECAMSVLVLWFVCLSYDASYDSSYDASYDECACLMMRRMIRRFNFFFTSFSLQITTFRVIMRYQLISHYDEVCHAQSRIAEFITFSWKSQPNLILRASALFLCMYIIYI